MLFKNIIIVFLGVILPILSWAQTSIVLRDVHSGLPITAAYYQYGDQQGVSTEAGEIILKVDETARLQLSHLSYGEVTLTQNQLQVFLELGEFRWTPAVQALQPVTVLAVHPQNGPRVARRFGDKDFLAHDAGALLMQSAAVQGIRKGGNYGFDPVFRGFKYDQLNVVIDGAQSATAACPNRMDPPTSQVSPNMMERVEILKGPHALRYGSGLGGTLYFVSAPPTFTDSPAWYGRLSGRYEENGQIRRTETALGRRDRNVDWAIFGSWSAGDDYVAGNDAEIGADFERLSLGTRLAYRWNKQQQIQVAATRNAARDTDFPTLPMDLREDDTWLLEATHTWRAQGSLLEKWETKMYATFVDHRMDNLLKPLHPRMVNAETEAITRTYGGRTETTLLIGNGLLYAGIDLRMEEAEGERVRNMLLGPMAGRMIVDNAWQSSIIRRPALFGEYQFQGAHWRWVIAGRLEVNQAEANDVSSTFAEQYDEVSETDVNPSVSIGGRRTLSGGWSMGIYAGRTQRSAGITERFINFFPVGLDPYELLGNPKLAPEANHQLDVDFQFKKEKITAQVNLFGAYLTHFITSEIRPELAPVMPTSPGVRQFVNLDEALLTGFEVVWTHKWSEQLQQRLDVAFTYGVDLGRNEPLPEIAPIDFRYTILGSFLENTLRPQIGIRLVSEQNRVSASFGETRTPGFILADAGLGYEAPFGVRIEAGVNNVFDETYYEHLSRSVRAAGNPPLWSPGRSLYFGMSFRF